MGPQAASRRRGIRPRLVARDERSLYAEHSPMPKEHRPRHGSMGFSPRKRSESPIPHFSSWPDLDGGSPKVQGFAGYKAGMTHAIVVDYRPTSTTSGQEVQIPVTVLEVPPMHVAAVGLHHREPEGLRTQAEVWSPKLDKELRRGFPIPKDYDAGEAGKKVDPAQIDDVRLITYTQPALLTGVPKKKPDLMENRVGGGSIEDRIEYAKQLLGTDIAVTEFCREGSMVDVAAITKGKGWKGHHTRWGTRLLSHKNSKHRRNIGTLGNFQPGYVRPTVPQGGQFGYHQRTEYNKRILKIGEKGEEINPSGGFLSAGAGLHSYVLLPGSLPGPAQRHLPLPGAAPAGSVKLEKSPELTYVSRESKQGV